MSSSAASNLSEFSLAGHLNLVGVAQLVSIRIEDFHVLVRVAIELLANLRQVIARFDGVGLALLARSAAAGGCAHRAALIDAEIRGQIILTVLIRQLVFVPHLVCRILRRSDAFDEKFIVLNVQVLQSGGGLLKNPMPGVPLFWLA